MFFRVDWLADQLGSQPGKPDGTLSKSRAEHYWLCPRRLCPTIPSPTFRLNGSEWAIPQKNPEANALRLMDCSRRDIRSTSRAGLD